MNICRCCLQPFEEEDFLDTNVIYDENEKLTYADCFFICTQTNLVESKALPYNLCKSCGLELQMAYDFHKKVKEANKVLENIFIDEGKLVESDNEFEAVNCSPTKEIEYNYEQTDSGAEIDEDRKESLLDVQLIDLKSNLEEEELNSEKEAVEFEWEEKNILEKFNHENDTKPSWDETNEINKKEKVVKQRKPKRSRYCDICHKTFADSRYLPKHQRIHDPHRERKKYKCQQCDKAFPTNSQLKIHSRSHTGEGYLCSVCSKLIYTKHDLKVHMRFHTRDFPYVCEVCGKRFALRGHMNYHMSAKHNGLRLSCKDCGKLFQNVRSFKTHTFLHTDMPFHCAYCVKKYPSKYKLKFHIRTKHGIELNNEALEKMRKMEIESYTHVWTKVDTDTGEKAV